MPPALLHKGCRNWMARRGGSAPLGPEGRDQNAGTPPPHAGEAARIRQLDRSIRLRGASRRAARCTAPTVL